jgi:hypothetical protein
MNKVLPFNREKVILYRNHIINLPLVERGNEQMNADS